MKNRTTDGTTTLIPQPKFAKTNPVMVINGPYRYHGIIVDVRFRDDHGWNAYEYLVKENDSIFDSQEWRHENQLI